MLFALCYFQTKTGEGWILIKAGNFVVNQDHREENMKRIVRKSWWPMLGVLVLLFGLMQVEIAGAANLSIAGGPSGGSYYPLSLGMAEAIGKNIPEIKVDVVNSAGAVENATLVGTGESDISITNGDAAYEAYSGTGRYAGKKLPQIRAMFGGIDGGLFHVVVSRASGIKSYAQIKGKKVAIGPQGGATPYMAFLILKYYGIQKTDMRLSYLNYGDGMQALQDGQVDVSMAVGSMPLAAVKQMATFGKFAFDIPSIDMDKAQLFLKEYPFYSLVSVPPDMYGLGYEAKGAASTNIAVVSAKLSDDLVYRMTKAIFENLNVLYNAHPSAKTIKLGSAPVKYLPMHPGAEKYFREKKVIQ
jgi:uncharacterized protein